MATTKDGTNNYTTRHHRLWGVRIQTTTTTTTKLQYIPTSTQYLIAWLCRRTTFSTCSIHTSDDADKHAQQAHLRDHDFGGAFHASSTRSPRAEGQTRSDWWRDDTTDSTCEYETRTKRV
jgi:hypothetical protein